MTESRQVYVQHREDESLMKISFRINLSPSLSKEMIFLRSKTEKLSSTLIRMKSKIENFNFPKSKKSKKKPKDTQVETNIMKSNSVELKLTYCGKELEDHDNVTNIAAWTRGSQFWIDGLCYDIVVNPPVVANLKLPTVITSGFRVYPFLCLECATREDSVFTWYRGFSQDQVGSHDKSLLAENGESWLKVGDSFFYSVSEQDIGCNLKVTCIPGRAGTFGRKEEAVSKTPVVMGLERYPFQDRHEFTRCLTTSGQIRCVSYNILADSYADTDAAKNELFAHCPEEYLNFYYRKQLYMREILGYNGDIVCLQEVDRKVFINDLTPVLSDAGLEGLYGEKGGTVPEGPACFYRTTKFRLLHFEAVELTEMTKLEPYLDNICQKLASNEKLKERFYERNSVLQLVVLQCLEAPHQRIIVGNTHLYSNADSDNIRLIQAYICVKYLEQKMMKFQSEHHETEISLIFCGDFNSCPEFGVYKFVTEGCVSDDCEDWKSNADEAVKGMLLRHSLSLKSAYGMPSYTNYTRGFSGCLDYIFYDSAKLRQVEIVPLPTHEQVIEHEALPSKTFPSDHLALICTLQILK